MQESTDEFRRVIERYQRTVFSIALRITGEYGVAEEVAQDVFLAFHRAADRPSSEDHTRFWLRRVAVHRATDALRRRRRRPETGGEEWTEAVESGESCRDHMAEREPRAIEARVEELLRTLPEVQRVALVLRYTEEMTPEEIAALLEQPLPTVKSHLARGLAMLRRKAAVTMKEYVRG